MGRPKGTKNKQQDDYAIALEVNGETLKSSGNTLLEALNGLQPSFYKTKGILTVFKGDKRFQRILFIPQMKRLFNEFSSFTRDTARAGTAKMLEQMLK